ncbi:hypothetical protein [Xylanibacter ruminicola]|uniref:hypothetical protein n=1 Tax=Xylanibacter ruminicola TaxID=839 RepID=UPI00048F1FBD|nr:hypothetical protein [Xylanibacter ruminicola]
MNKILASFVLATMTTSAFAQSNTNSPYSQFGLGDLTDQSVGFNKGMNGVGVAMRRGNEVNPMNPASYSAVDSLTMLFDAGLSGQITNFKENGKKMNGKSGGFDYVVGQFRAFKGVGVTFGVLPYSNIGYNYSQSEYLNDANITKMTTTNKGDGGIHQLFIGTGIRLFKPLSIGANLSYFWGDYNRTITSSSSASNVSALQMLYTTDISSYKLDLGMQLELPLSKQDNITLGATWTPGHSLKADANCSVINSNSTISKADTTAYKLADALSIPTSFGFGLAYNHGQQFRMGADFTMQKWGSVDYPSFDSQAKTYTLKSGLLKDSYRFNLGAEWTPRPMGRKFLQRVRYRAGVGMATPYYYINGKEGPKELSASIGFGIPIMNGYNGRSYLNISGQVVNRSADNMIKETMFRLNIGLTFNERWFAKWKVE